MNENIAQLDLFDRKILAIVQENNRVPNDVLADRVGISASTCLRRLRRLREAGVISKDVSIIEPKMAGRGLSMIVNVTLERERADIIDSFKAAVRKTPEIMQAYYVTGESDFVLIVTAKDMEDYEAFSRRFFYENKNIKGFRTTMIMDAIKTGFVVPLDN
ncbi:ArsR family transcriptional regulator [Ruegeria sp. ANG-S4]|uniref:Lrp/AsnC family transcriptional regulator n=1 Tax=Ruegeria sp. ANG-S4 TaxID=1577904 RepID=UPI00057DB22B|nr:Lrp/AsnC family transcriptional regulator [Ruegeria sp. ANG-S4]KIC45905.1 ArsR family transcriptional regulator [Ruegeria sp. ANG-S4]